MRLSRLIMGVLVAALCAGNAAAAWVYPPQTVDWIVEGSAIETVEEMVSISKQLFANGGPEAEWTRSSTSLTLDFDQTVTFEVDSCYECWFQVTQNGSVLFSFMGTTSRYLNAGSYDWVVSVRSGGSGSATAVYTKKQTNTYAVTAQDAGTFDVHHDSSSDRFVLTGDTDYLLTFKRSDDSQAVGNLSNVMTSHSTTNPDVILGITGTSSGTLSAVITKTIFVNDPPSPPNYLSGIGTLQQHALTEPIELAWSQVSDPNGDPVSYRLYLGMAPESMAMVQSGAATSYQAAVSAFGLPHYWQVAAVDGPGAVSSGPVAEFTVIFVNDPPRAFAATDGVGTEVLRVDALTFAWEGNGDPDGDAVEYRFSLGTDLQKVSQGFNEVIVPADSFTLIGFSYGTTYYWSVAAVDPFGAFREVAGGIQSYLPILKNSPPTAPQVLAGSGEFAQHALESEFRLMWSESRDWDGDPISYRVLLGTAPSGLRQVQDGDLLYYDLTGTTLGTTYYWMIETRDSFGGRTETAVQALHVVLDNEPPWPFSASAGIGILETRENTATISWWPSFDPDRDAVTYELLVSTEPTRLSSVQVSTETSYILPISLGTTYYWEVVARDTFGAESVLGPKTLLPVLRNAAPTALANLTASGNIPFHGHDPSLSFFWSDAFDADGDSFNYGVEFGTDSSALIEMTPVERGHTISDLKVDLIYYYRIVATDEYGARSDSPLQWVRFEFVNDNPGAFDPIEGMGVFVTRDDSRRISWRESVDPDAGDQVLYRVLAGTSPTSLAEQETTTLTHSFLQGLTFAATYYWLVEANDVGLVPAKTR